MNTVIHLSRDMRAGVVLHSTYMDSCRSNWPSFPTRISSKN